MNSRTIPALLAGLLAITQFSANAHAALAEICFASKYDYELYLKHGDSPPPPPDSAIHDDNPEEYDIHLNAYEQGSVQKKGITIHVDHTTSAGKIISNASRSSTPSGEKQFAWGSPGNTTSTSAEYTSNAGAPGTYRNVPLTVKDPVCELEASTQVRIYSQ
ncbi:hypothetical protein [Pseudomonas japonica]|uniref:Uncharacterized protein n=1 Tax=Pseudomonas japonica TaxID=256466 RepID=A0A239J9L4_9PSED|nr:hypothetical protein [Pseudomonas japonica]SNT02706.1 hypothetical protein SAMN05444352_12191 [Pseudomonas japonica]